MGKSKKTQLISSNSNPKKRCGSIRLPKACPIRFRAASKEWKVPDEFRLGQKHGIRVGFSGNAVKGSAGIPQGTDGNLLVIGGNGSGKSLGVAKPTLESWSGPLFATDIKGELSAHYAELLLRGKVSRPFLIVDPTDPAGPSYDPFWLLETDGPDALVRNAFDLAAILCPASRDGHDRFWTMSEQAVLAAAIIWGFDRGLSFSETTAFVLSKPLGELGDELQRSGDERVRAILGEVGQHKGEMLADIERGVRNNLMSGVADPCLAHFLRGRRETRDAFGWGDLDRCNVFLRLPPEKIETWGWVVRLLCAQLLRHLERRPEKHSEQGSAVPQTLLLLDEFPRFGPVEPLANALATLRSKRVNICLLIQSIAQLDHIYGQPVREIILDNTQFKLILQAGDPETQEALSRMIGTGLRLQNSLGVSMDAKATRTESMNWGTAETQDFRIPPHQLATLKKPVFLTPLGICKVKKFLPNDVKLSTDSGSTGTSTNGLVDRQKPGIRQEGRLTLSQRIENARVKLAKFEEQTLADWVETVDQQAKAAQRRKMAVGSVVLSYFPALQSVNPGRNQEEAVAQMAIVSDFLEELSKPENAAILRKLQDEACQAYMSRKSAKNQENSANN